MRDEKTLSYLHEQLRGPSRACRLASPLASLLAASGLIATLKTVGPVVRWVLEVSRGMALPELWTSAALVLVNAGVAGWAIPEKWTPAKTPQSPALLVLTRSTSGKASARASTVLPPTGLTLVGATEKGIAFDPVEVGGLKESILAQTLPAWKSAGTAVEAITAKPVLVPPPPPHTGIETRGTSMASFPSSPGLSSGDVAGLPRHLAGEVRQTQTVQGVANRAMAGPDTKGAVFERTAAGGTRRGLASALASVSRLKQTISARTVPIWKAIDTAVETIATKPIDAPPPSFPHTGSEAQGIPGQRVRPQRPLLGAVQAVEDIHRQLSAVLAQASVPVAPGPDSPIAGATQHWPVGDGPARVSGINVRPEGVQISGGESPYRLRHSPGEAWLSQHEGLASHGPALPQPDTPLSASREGMATGGAMTSLAPEQDLVKVLSRQMERPGHLHRRARRLTWTTDEHTVNLTIQTGEETETGPHDMSRKLARLLASEARRFGVEI